MHVAGWRCHLLPASEHLHGQSIWQKWQAPALSVWDHAACTASRGCKSRPHSRRPASAALLQAYAAAFFAIPFVRWLRNARRNAAIDARNEARKEALALLSRPDKTLLSKLAGAARQARQRVVTDRWAAGRAGGTAAGCCGGASATGQGGHCARLPAEAA